MYDVVCRQQIYPCLASYTGEHEVCNKRTVDLLSQTYGKRNWRNGADCLRSLSALWLLSTLLQVNICWVYWLQLIPWCAQCSFRQSLGIETSTSCTVRNLLSFCVLVMTQHKARQVVINILPLQRCFILPLSLNSNLFPEVLWVILSVLSLILNIEHY